MSTRPLKLTPQLLRRIVKEEKEKIVAEAAKKAKKAKGDISADAEELDAHEQASAVKHAENHYKGLEENARRLLQIVENEKKLAAQLQRIRESKAALRAKIKKSA
jgi:hypothetical protein